MTRPLRDFPPISDVLLGIARTRGPPPSGISQHTGRQHRSAARICDSRLNSSGRVVESAATHVTSIGSAQPRKPDLPTGIDLLERANQVFVPFGPGAIAIAGAPFGDPSRACADRRTPSWAAAMVMTVVLKKRRRLKLTLPDMRLSRIGFHGSCKRDARLRLLIEYPCLAHAAVISTQQPRCTRGPGGRVTSAPQRREKRHVLVRAQSQFRRPRRLSHSA